LRGFKTLLKDRIAPVTGSIQNIEVGTALPVDGGSLNAMNSGSSR
jgi:hypothetical protein